MNVLERFPSTAIADKLGLRWILTPEDHSGPNWTGDTFIVNYSEQWDDALLWHELTHWLVADEEQRKHPDYGIGRNVNSTGKAWFSSECRDGHESVDYESAWGNFYVGSDEADRQECESVELLLWYPLAVGRFDPEILALTFKTVSDFGGLDYERKNGQDRHVFRSNLDEVVKHLAPLNLDEAEIRAWPKRFKALCPEMKDVHLTTRPKRPKIRDHSEILSHFDLTVNRAGVTIEP